MGQARRCRLGKDKDPDLRKRQQDWNFGRGLETIKTEKKERKRTNGNSTIKQSVVEF